MMEQTRKRKVPHTYKELIRRIDIRVWRAGIKGTTKVVWNIAITGKNKNKSETPYMPRVFWNNVTGFTDEPVVQCDVPAVIKTSLDDDINDDRK